MYIQSFKITNFRSFENLELDDLPPLFLLFGLNGSGKSNLLAALEAIFSRKLQHPYQPGAPQDFAPFYRGLLPHFHHNYHRNNPTNIDFEIVLRTSKNELENLWAEAFQHDVSVLPKTNPPHRIRISLLGHFEPEPELPGTAQIFLESAHLNDLPLFDASAKGEPWLPGLRAELDLGERAATGEALLNKLTGAFSGIGTARFLRREPFLSTLDESSQTQPDYAASFKRRLFNLKHSQLQTDQAKFRRITDIFHSTAGWGEIDFAQAGPAGEDLEVMTWDEHELWLPVTQRGAGAEQLLVLVSEVVISGAMMVGIEELESNLDDENQQKLFDLLQNLVSRPETGIGQVIATAHSSLYAHSLETHQKRLVHVDDDGRSIVDPWSPDTYAQIFRPRLL